MREIEARVKRIKRKGANPEAPLPSRIPIASFLPSRATHPLRRARDSHPSSTTTDTAAWRPPLFSALPLLRSAPPRLPPSFLPSFRAVWANRPPAHACDLAHAADWDLSPPPSWWIPVGQPPELALHGWNGKDWTHKLDSQPSQQSFRKPTGQFSLFKAGWLLYRHLRALDK